MNSGPEFEAREHQAAANFAAAAREAKVRRIVYLGGLASGSELSPHMHSRAATGNILRSSGIPVIEFQASIVIGSGSASFEVIRSLVDRLPVMITPRWVNTAAQPIAIEDVIEYLAAATRTAAEGEPHRRNRRERRHLLCRDHARICPPTETAALDIARSLPQFVAVEPLADADHARLCVHRALPDRKRPPSERSSESRRHGVVCGPAHGDYTGHRASFVHRRPTHCGEPLVRRRGPADGAAPEPSRDLLINEQTIRVAATPERAFAPIRRIGGRNGLVLRQPAVENPRADRSDDGRRRDAARPARP